MTNNLNETLPPSTQRNPCDLNCPAHVWIDLYASPLETEPSADTHVVARTNDKLIH